MEQKFNGMNFLAISLYVCMHAHFKGDCLNYFAGGWRKNKN